MRTSRPAPRRDARAGVRLSSLAVAVLAATTTATLAACDDGAVAPSGLRLTDAPPGITGVVTAVTAGESVVPPPNPGDPNVPVSCPPSCGSPRPLRTVRIEEIPGSLLSGGDKSIVTVPRGVPVLRRAASGLTVAAFDSLRVGQRVSAWFDGPILESYPSQARARVVVIER